MTQRRCARSSTARGFVSRCSSFPTREHGGSEGLTPMHVDGVASLNTSSLAITRVEWGRMCSGRCARTEISGTTPPTRDQQRSQRDGRHPEARAAALSHARARHQCPAPLSWVLHLANSNARYGMCVCGEGGYAIDYCDYFYT